MTQCSEQGEYERWFIKDKKVDLSIANTIFALLKARNFNEWNIAGDNKVYFNYNGKYLHLCRTDFKDDIRTWVESTTTNYFSDPLGYFAINCRYGARITDESFYVIDAYSDG